jgi:DNA polymerase-3 subunit gamma/tau
MSFICKQEKLKADAVALARIARAATGSMRDALSLLDQAVAFGGGKLSDDDVADMLGSLDRRHINGLLACLVAGDASGLMVQVRELQALVPDYESVLNDLATVLQQIAVLKLAGVESLDEDADVEILQEFADALSDDLVQLYYQIAVTGRRDIDLAPDPRLGFEMALLRMIAFRPADAAQGSMTGGAPAAGKKAAKASTGSGKPKAAQAAQPAAALSADTDWPGIIDGLKLKGVMRQLAQNCQLVGRTEAGFQFNVSRASEHLLTDQQKQRLIDALRAAYGNELQVKFELVDDIDDTVAQQEVNESALRLRAARDSIHNDPDLQQIVDVFGAEIESDSIRPVNGSSNS